LQGAKLYLPRLASSFDQGSQEPTVFWRRILGSFWNISTWIWLLMLLS